MAVVPRAVANTPPVDPAALIVEPPCSYKNRSIDFCQFLLTIAIFMDLKSIQFLSIT
jgi:hypothetical protein